VQSVVTTDPTQTGKSRAVTGVIVKDQKDELERERKISGNVVVNCTGMWARQLGEAIGVTIPNQAVEHYYLITGDIDGLDPSWPIVEDPSRCIYVRPGGKGLLVEFFETKGVSWEPHNIPSSFAFGELDPVWDRMAPYLESALERLTSKVQKASIKTFFCGPESFTPDNSLIVGSAPYLSTGRAGSSRLPQDNRGWIGIRIAVRGPQST